MRKAVIPATPAKFAAALCIIAGIMSSGAMAATLSDSVSQALDTHPAIAAKKATVDAAKSSVREQRSAFFPQIGVNGRFGRVHQDDDTTRVFTGGFATSWLGEESATLSQPIFTGFSNINRLRAAKDRQTSAQFDLSGSTNDIALRAARAHLNLMRTHDLLDIARKYMDAIQGRKDSISLMVREGAGDHAELLQAEEILMAAKTTRLGYEEAFRQAEADYIAAVGASPGRVLEFGPQTWKPLVPLTIEQAIAQGTAASPQVKAAEALVAALGKEAAADKGTLVPRLDAEFSGLNRDQHEELGGEVRNMQGMLKLSWNFATGGGQLARVDRVLSLRREAAAKRDDARRNVEHDVRQRYTSMTIIDQQYDLMRARERAGEEILVNLTSQFEGGRQSNLQLINANARLFEARASRTDAYYRRLLARFELLSVMGSLRDAFTPDALKPVKSAKAGAPAKD